jgi:protein-S-isoprenylcysteine O-methyltransferase Ste14
MALHEEFEKQGNWLFKYRSFLPLIILLIGAVLYIRTEINPGPFTLKATPYEIYYEVFALFVSLVGFSIRVYTVGHTPKNTSGRNASEGQVADTLNTTGIYSIVRHPLYLGNFLMWLGPALLTGNLWFIVSFCMLFCIYYERIMYAEEQFLRNKFGSTYLQWSKNVPPFIPKIENFKKSDLPFSWKKVLGKEKNGLFALFLIFCLFDLMGEYVKDQSNYNYHLMALCTLTGVVYLILKFIKRKTGLLNEVDRSRY